jgi:hypothetical protein
MQIKQHTKEYFMNKSKSELAEICMDLEHNYNVVDERFEKVVKLAYSHSLNNEVLDK